MGDLGADAGADVGAGDDDDDDGAVGVPGNEYCQPTGDWDEQAVRLEAEVLTIVNQRRSEGATCGGQAFGAAPPLSADPALTCAARIHSLDMAERNFFDHNNLDGESPFDRMMRAGYVYSTAGENIAAGQPTAEQVMQGWMQSDGHCRNIMNPDFVHFGGGYVSTATAAYPAYWTQTFGAR